MEWTPEDVAAATARFAAALTRADPTADVRACPSWTVLDLTAHLGSVHSWAAAVVASGAAQDDAESEAELPLDQWYAERAAHLVGALEAADPAAPCWNFARVGEVAGFWIRRQVLETLMHLVDLDQAHGRSTRLDPGTCADGVSETFEVFLPRLHARGLPADLSAPVSFLAADTGDAWTLHPEPGSHPRLTRDAASEHRVSGTAEQLWLRLWNRGDQVEVVGEPARRLLGSRLSA